MKFTKRIKALFFPLHWTRACLSVDSMAGKVRVVVDEQLLGEEIYDMEKDVFRPDNFSLLLGYDKYSEYTGQISELNIFCVRPWKNSVEISSSASTLVVTR